jgi:voltage-gated potassium channel
VSNPLLIFWQQLFGPRRAAADEAVSRTHLEFADQASATIFLILRRMRTPLIVLILVFSISTVGLALIPGVGPDGEPARMTLFDAFYFMSYTATTIGFGELPWPFTTAQRLWVTSRSTCR